MAIDASIPNPGIGKWHDNKIHSICPVDFKGAPLFGFDFVHEPASSWFLGQQEADDLGAACQSRGKAERFGRLLLTITVRNETFFLNPLAVPKTFNLETRAWLRIVVKANVNAVFRWRNERVAHDPVLAFYKQ